MGIAEELAKLQQLRQAGALTDAEFAAAKRKLLAEDATNTLAPPVSQIDVDTDLKDELNEFIDDSSTLGGAANRYVSYKFVSLLVSVVLFIIMLFFMASMFNRTGSGFNSFPRPNGLPFIIGR